MDYKADNTLKLRTIRYFLSKLGIKSAFSGKYRFVGNTMQFIFHERIDLDDQA